jgi:hypothetical protein
MPPGPLAHLVRVVLTLDHVLPKTISVAVAQDLIEASMQLLHALSVEEGQYLRPRVVHRQDPRRDRPFTHLD